MEETRTTEIGFVASSLIPGDVAKPESFNAPNGTFKRNSKVIVRRHSSQAVSGEVFPIPERGPSDTPRYGARILRRNSTRRGPTYTTKSLASLISGNRHDLGAKNQTQTRVESPYEEMLVRFQIRQLSAQSLTDFSETKTEQGEAIADDQTSNGTEVGATPRRTNDYISQDRDTQDLNRPQSTPVVGDEFLGNFSIYQDKRRHIVWRGKLKLVFRHLITPVSPFSWIVKARYLTILLATTIYIFYFPLGFAFPNETPFTRVSGVIGIILGLDILFAFHTSYVTKNGSVVNSHGNIALHYVKTRFLSDAILAAPLIVRMNYPSSGSVSDTWLRFVLDIVSAERFVYVGRFVRLIWLARINESGAVHSFWAWLLYSRYSHLLRIGAMVMTIIAIAHYMACIWTLLLEESDDYDGSMRSWRDQYIAGFYVALLLLQGQGVRSNTAGQNFFASLSTLLGSIVLAVVFGHVGILVSNFNANATNYQRKMEAVIAMTAKLQLPSSLRERIHLYYEHLWHEYECLDGEIVQFSKELSHTLGLEVVLFKYMELVMQIPFWADCSADFQKQLMLRLDVRVYLPDDFIMRQGEVDDEFYMVNRGYCEVSREAHRFERVTASMLGDFAQSNAVSTGRGISNFRRNSIMKTRRRSSSLKSASTVADGYRQSAYELDADQRRYYYSNAGRRFAKGLISLVSRGQAFGDLALLMNYSRAANVRAVTHVEMCVLSRDNFQAVLARYPGDRHRVVVDMLTSFMQCYEISQTRCPLLEMVRSVYSPEAIAEELAKSGEALPIIPTELTTRQAAERIYTAINVEMEDTTLKFGVNGRIRDQLIELRERRRRKRDSRRRTTEHKKTVKQKDSVNSANANPHRQEEMNTPLDHTTQALTNVPQTDQVQPPMEGKLSLQERLRRVGEREVAILNAVKELQKSFNLLQAQELAANRPYTPNRKSSANDVDSPLSRTESRPRLLQRMGSFVRMSGSTSESKNGAASPTRYADQLFKMYA